jgi:hypothetical protein
MTAPAQVNNATHELDELKQIRNLVHAFQQMIAHLDASERNNDFNEQFNKFRFQAKSLLHDNSFESQVPKAVSAGSLAERAQKTNVRLSVIVFVGVLLALVGLGINSIILDDFWVNSLGCLISTGGTLLVMGAFVVLGITAGRRKLTDLGQLYQLCDVLLVKVDSTLGQMIPNYPARLTEPLPQTPTTATLMLDSLEKQVVDWNEKLTQLKQQRNLLGPSAPIDLNINIAFVERELQRAEFEIADLQKRGAVSLRQTESPPFSPNVAVPVPPLRQAEPESDWLAGPEETSPPASMLE